MIYQGKNQHSFYELRTDVRLKRIYELNHLMERVAALDDIGRAKMSVMCSVYLNGAKHRKTHSVAYEPTIAHAINLTHNLDSIKVIKGVYNYNDLARYCIEHKVKGYEGYSDIDPEKLDYDKIGRECPKRLGGLFSMGYTFVYNLPAPDEMINPYDGRSLLSKPEPVEEPEPRCELTMGGMY